MAYFSEFPTIEYDIDKDGKTVILTNILRGVQFNSVLKENILLHQRYAFEDTDRPEHIADKVYKDSELHWLILSLNGAIDPNYDISVSEAGLFAYTNEKYPGQTYFMGDAVGTDPFVNISGSFTNGEYVYRASGSSVDGGDVLGASFDSLNPRIKLGSGSTTDDVYNGAVVFIDDDDTGQFNVITDYNGTTKWATLLNPVTPVDGFECGAATWEVYPSGKVNRWDATYSRLEVTGVYGTISEDDLLIGVTSGTSGYVRRKVSFSRDAVHHFENVDTGKWYDPYDSDTQYLAGYAVRSTSPNSAIEATVITNQQYEKDLNDGKRFISILQTGAIGQARADFERIMDEE